MFCLLLARRSRGVQARHSPGVQGPRGVHGSAIVFRVFCSIADQVALFKCRGALFGRRRRFFVRTGFIECIRVLLANGPATTVTLSICFPCTHRESGR